MARKPSPNGTEVYYPVQESRTLEYRYESPEFQNGEPGVSRITFSKVRKEKRVTTAKLTEVITNGAEWGRWVSTLRLTATRVSFRDRVTGEEVLLLKAPIQKGTSWEDGPYEVKIAAIRERVKVPAGTFICVKVSHWNEDIGSGSRWYAPGIGLVKAEQFGEHMPFLYELQRVDAPKK